MKREDYKLILDAFITCESCYRTVHTALWGGEPESVMLRQEGLFSKVMELEKIVKEYSVYDDKHTDEELDEFFEIIDSTEISLDEKVDRLYQG
ncbi:MAG: hypothetical protein K6G88_10145 [Lachnospiraceae bacterium]|nr:hypothetical protein [Lachnospiraceae bacterium]